MQNCHSSRLRPPDGPGLVQIQFCTTVPLPPVLLAQRAQERERAALCRDLSALAQKLAQLEARPGAAVLQQLLAAPPAPVAVATPAPAAPAPAPAPVPAAEPPEHDRARALEDEFHHESRDQAWAPSTETTLRARLAGAGREPAALRSVECRAQRCRVELSGDDEGRRLLDEVLRPGPGAVWPGAAHFVALDDAGAGAPALLAYLERG